MQKAIDTGIVCAKPRRDISQVLRTLILQFTRYPTPDQYVTVCRRLVEKFPKLRDDENNGYVSNNCWKSVIRILGLRTPWDVGTYLSKIF